MNAEYDPSYSLINVIDVWDIQKRNFQDQSDETVSVIKQDTDAFAKFLTVKLRYYLNNGAHLNLALHGTSINPNLTVDFQNKFEDSSKLKFYMKSNGLTELVICGQHLHKCISSRPTGYTSMKKLISNTKVAITLCRALPQDHQQKGLRFVDVPFDDWIYL